MPGFTAGTLAFHTILLLHNYGTHLRHQRDSFPKNIGKRSVEIRVVVLVEDDSIIDLRWRRHHRTWFKQRTSSEIYKGTRPQLNEPVMPYQA